MGQNAVKTLYISPSGTCDGSENNPTDYQSNIFWQGVKAALVGDSVVVYILDVQYRIEIPALEIGHPDHPLFLEGFSSSRAVFVIPEDETPQDTILCTSKERKL